MEQIFERLGYVTEEEPFKKLINQGMIQGRSNFVYRSKFIVYTNGKVNDLISNQLPAVYISFNLKKLLITNSSDLKVSDSMSKGVLDSKMMDLE